MNYIPNTEEDKKEMLKEIGVNSVNELFKDIPEDILLKKRLRLPKAMSELELKQHLVNLSEKNKIMKLFIGAGSYSHFIPSVVNHIISKSEFYTAYTPYQPELSQGILQAIYEYQTMICDLTGMDVANASMYDGASALAEACVMAVNITKKNEILMSKTIHPEYRETVKTYCHFHNIDLVEIELDDGVSSIEELKNKISSQTAAVLIQNPNFFGCLENLNEISKIAHENKALLVACVVEPTSLCLLKSLGELGADIVVGEGQSFGNALNFGGPYLGIIATKQEYVRYIPGRLVGMTEDTEGRKGFILTLQAREQHIRREKASSNICSNEALCALAATVYLSVMGKKGLKTIAELCLQKSYYLFNKLKEIGFKAVFNQPFYNEFVVKVNNVKKINKLLLKKGIVGGLELRRYYPKLKNCMLFCTTEMNSEEDIGELVRVLKNAANL